jgi:hypothetical protein
MIAIRKFVHLSLLAAFLLASFGFRVNLESCPGDKTGKISFAANPACCCDKAGKNPKVPSPACSDMTCIVLPGFNAYPATQAAAEQAIKFLKTPASAPGFTQIIRPALLAKTPHFSLPPPLSGRFLGILHQTFRI